MNKFSMTCSCGDVLNADAATREEAVTKIQGMMTQDAINAHFAEKHAGQPVPPMADVHALIATGTVAA
jgi:hypothetical protein